MSQARIIVWLSISIRLHDRGSKFGTVLTEERGVRVLIWRGTSGVLEGVRYSYGKQGPGSVHCIVHVYMERNERLTRFQIVLLLNRLGTMAPSSSNY